MEYQRQMLSAVAYAHQKRVIHCDLKPDNILICGDNQIRLMDFGIARSAMDTTGLTATGVIIGTPDYMSPEQVKGQKADQRSDLFSLGVILYEMLTGDLPYKADTPASKVMMRLSHKPRAPRQITLEIPKYLEQVILKCMEVDPTLPTCPPNVKRRTCASAAGPTDNGATDRYAELRHA